MLHGGDPFGRRVHTHTDRASLLGGVAAVATAVVLFGIFIWPLTGEADYVRECVCLSILVNGRIARNAVQTELGRFNIHRLPNEMLIVCFVD